MLGLLVATLISVSPAKPDPFFAAITKEMNNDTEVLYCYEKSDSGRAKKKARVILDIKVNERKKPTLVAAILNPKSSKDKTLTECLEKVLMNYVYPLPRGRSELQLDLFFPVKK